MRLTFGESKQEFLMDTRTKFEYLTTELDEIDLY